MTAFETHLTSAQLRDLLTSFWNGVLEIESTPHRHVFTMPASFPDGWQVVLELTQVAPGKFRLSDRGKTLSWLAGEGLNTATDATARHIERLCAEHFMQREQGVLFRWLDAPLDATDIQVFAEGLVATSRLDILNEHRPTEESVADIVVQQILKDAGLVPKRRHKLFITEARPIAVDYYVEPGHPTAIQILRTKTDLSGTMEKWRFRWRELRKRYTGLAPIMLYDRNLHNMEPYGLHIGQSECTLLCGYDEEARIHEALRPVA